MEDRMEPFHKRSAWQGFLSLFGSMLLYAFSGVVVVGLSAAFGSIGQVTFRALAALVLTIIWLTLTGIRYKLSKKYPTKWLVVDIVSRSIFNTAFVYAVMEIGPTSALFYLFSSKVVVGGLLKLVINNGQKLKGFDYLSYLVVIVGLFVYSYPINALISVGVGYAFISGTFEAIKSRAMEVLKVDNEDRPVVSLYEFASLSVITFFAVVLTGQQFVVATISPAVWFVLGCSAVIAVGSLALELFGFSNFDDDLGNSILASEMGFAGLINYVVLGTVMLPTQIAGAALLVISLIFVAVASHKRNLK